MQVVKSFEIEEEKIEETKNKGTLIRTHKFTDGPDQYLVVLRTDNGKIFVGGSDGSLASFDREFRPLKIKIFHNWIRSGLTIGNTIYLGVDDKEIKLLDDDLKLLQTVKIQSNPRKLKLYADKIICG